MAKPRFLDGAGRVRAPLSLFRLRGVLACGALAIGASISTGLATNWAHRRIVGTDGLIDNAGARRDRDAEASARDRVQTARAALPRLRERLLSDTVDPATTADTPSWLAYIELAAHIADVQITSFEQLPDAARPLPVKSPSATESVVGEPGLVFQVGAVGSFAALSRFAGIMVTTAPALVPVSVSMRSEGERRVLDATVRVISAAPTMASLDVALRGAENMPERALDDPFAGTEPTEIIVGVIESGGRRTLVTAGGRLVGAGTMP